MYIEWSRKWDWKNGNRVACFKKAYDGKDEVLAGAFRYKTGDQSELGPWPKDLAEHQGWKIIQASTAECEKRARVNYPELFTDESKILRTAGVSVCPEFRG